MALTFVIDVSGPMDREDRLTLVKRALTLLVEELRPTDSVAIVVYGSDARAVLPPTCGDDRDRILSAIYGVEPRRDRPTPKQGCSSAMPRPRSPTTPSASTADSAVGRRGKRGPDRPEAILRTIEEYAMRGVYLTIGRLWPGQLQRRADGAACQSGDGIYAYVDNIREAQRIFVEDLPARCKPSPRTPRCRSILTRRSWRATACWASRTGPLPTTSSAMIRSMPARSGPGTATALYEIKRHPDAEGPIATVYLRWQDPQSREVSEVNVTLDSAQLTPAFTETSPSFQLAVIVAEYAEVLRESYWAQENTLAGVQEEAERIGGLFEGNADVEEFVELTGRAKAAQG